MTTGTDELAVDLATELLRATAERRPVEPLAVRFPDLTVDDAYAVQLAQERHHLAAGRRLAGRKVGLTSTAMQRQLGIDSPDFGFVFADMVHGDGARIRADGFIAPRIEPEFAFRLDADLVGPGVTATDAAAVVASVHAALEIIDSRIVDWRIGLVDTVADNASCGAIVVGPELSGVDPADLGDVGCTLVVDGERLRTGYGRDVLGDPLEALAWLANTLGARGVPLRAGQVVLPGAFVAAAPVTAGTTAAADFGPLGAVEVTFV